MDGSNNATLLTVNRAADSYCEVSSVVDAYGRAVYYKDLVYTNPGVPANVPWSSYLELNQASPVLQSGLSNPTMRWTYGYNVYPNGVTGESVNMLHTISVPSPTGTGTSTATVDYDSSTTDGLTGTMTDTIDANGNKRAYFSYSGAVTEPPPAQPAAGSNTRVSVSNVNGTALIYTVTCNGNLDLTGVYDSSATQVYAAQYGDSGNPDRPTSVTVGSTSDSSARTTTLEWCDYGNLMRVTPPKGANSATIYTWNASAAFPMGLLTGVQQGSKPQTQFAYWPASGLPKTITAPMPMGTGGNIGFVTTSFFFSNLGNMTEVDEPGNNAAATLKTFLNYTSDPGDGAHGVPSYSQQEALGEPLTVTDSAGKVTHLRFDQRANTTTAYDALGDRTLLTPTLADQLSQITYPATGQTGPGNATTAVSYLYPGGPPTTVAQGDESGYLVRLTHLTYGNEGELISQGGGSSETATYSYTPAYQLYQLFDGSSHKTTYAHDLSGDPTSIQSQNGDTITLGPYTKAGDLTRRVDARGVTSTYTYADPDGLLTQIAYSDGTPTVTLQYDQYDRRSQMNDGTGAVTYAYGNQDELLNTITTYTGLSGRQIAYVYWPDGSRQAMHTLAGQYSYNYDLARRMNSLSNPYAESSAWSYRDNGWLSSQTLGNGITTTYTWNPRGFLTDLQSVPNGHSYASDFGSILADAVGNRTSVQPSLPGVSGFSGALTYAYRAPGGSLDQLTGEQSTRTPAYNFAYTPDPAGNLQTIRTTTGIQYDGDNQISNLPSVHYDLAGNPTTYPAPGNQTATQTFDAANRLTGCTPQSGTPVSFGYNGDGLRAWKQVGTNTSGRIYYLYDGSQPVAELNYNGTVLNAANTFGANGLLSRHTSSSTFYTFDPQGSVCQRFGSSANLLSSDQYDAFGGLQAQSPANVGDVFGYGAQWGYQTDPETGLLLLTNRYYDPGLARFLTRDPLGPAGGINLYAYCGNNPATLADPLGLFGFPEAWVLTGGVLGGIGGAIVCDGNPLCIAIGAGLGAALFQHQLNPDVGAALDTGLGVTCDVLTFGELGSAAFSAYPRGGQYSLPFEEFENEVAHGNSLSSQRPQHLYVIYDPTGGIEKFGISGGAVNAAGQSERAEEQLDELSQVYGGTFRSEIIEHHPDRAAASDAERAYVTVYFETFGRVPRSNYRPKPFPPGWLR